MEEHNNKHEGPACPICGKTDSIISIVYGYPAPETMEEANRGETRLGGCIITGDMRTIQEVDENGKLQTVTYITNEGPSHYCNECNHKF